MIAPRRSYCAAHKAKVDMEALKGLRHRVLPIYRFIGRIEAAKTPFFRYGDEAALRSRV